MNDPKRELFRVSEDFAAHMRLLDILKSTGEDTGPLEQTIAEYFTHEVTRERIDSVINYIRERQAQAEAAINEIQRLTELKDSCWTQIDWLKDTAKRVLEASGEKRLEGTTAGSLTLRVNGGKAAVLITDASLVPEELVQYEGWISGTAWRVLFFALREYSNLEWLGREDVQLKRVPSLSRIAAELDKPCERCKGTGELECAIPPPASVVCPECGGSGKRRVAGARFAERGSSVIVK